MPLTTRSTRHSPVILGCCMCWGLPLSRDATAAAPVALRQSQVDTGGPGADALGTRELGLGSGRSSTGALISGVLLVALQEGLPERPHVGLWVWSPPTSPAAPAHTAEAPVSAAKHVYTAKNMVPHGPLLCAPHPPGTGELAQDPGAERTASTSPDLLRPGLLVAPAVRNGETRC